MPVDLSIVESTTELGQTVVQVVLESASTPGPQGAAGAAGVTDADFLVGTAHAGLSAEIVVGTTPGGELGGTWASPTVDAVHSGSSHAATQAAAEATAAAALATHEADTTNVHGIANTAALALAADLTAHLNDTADAHDASAISVVPFGTIAATDVQAALEEVVAEASSGAPTNADYLVGTANGSLSNEIVVGTTPGGELGGTWASPTVDASHSGSTHAAVQAAAEATAAAALAAHTGDTSDAHDASAISVDSTTLSGTGTDVQASLEELDNLLDDHSARHENGGADEISIAGLDGTPTELTNHLNDATDAHDASAISVVSTTLSGTGTDVQAVFEEIDNLLDDHSARHENGGADEISIAGLDGTPTELTNHLNDATDAHDASAISYAGSATISATDVEAALDELDTEKTTAAAALTAAQTEIADQKRVLEIIVSDPNGSAITTGDGKAHVFIPALLNGHNLVAAHAAVTTVSSSGTPTVQIANVTQAADMLSTKITIDANEKTSYSAATPPVIDTGNDDVATGDELRVDIDVAGTGAKGLVVILTFEAP